MKNDITVTLTRDEVHALINSLAKLDKFNRRAGGRVIAGGKGRTARAWDKLADALAG